jgi:predicted DNA-binding ribbon-helix-helix protein
MTPPPKKSKSLVTKRSIYIGSRKSSVHVEDLFWAALWEIANTEGVKVTKLLTSIDGDRYTPNHLPPSAFMCWLTT